MKLSNIRILAVIVWIVGLAGLLMISSPAAAQPAEPDAWFYDSHQTFMRLRGALNGQKVLDPKEHSRKRGQCLTLVTEYNKRAAKTHPGVFKKRSLPTMLSGKDCG